MIYKRYQPATTLQRLIECYWIIEDDDTTIHSQKIIPDGFTEIIFHYGEPYRINLDNEWKSQSTCLLAGQISNYFFLENTGVSGVLGVKFKPAALTHLFRLNMHLFTNKVVDLYSVPGINIGSLEKDLKETIDHDSKIALLDNYFTQLIQQTSFTNTPVDAVIELIFQQHGMVTVAELSKVATVGERQLENLFKKWVGLSPKLFARIIRFSYIFELVQQNNQSWSGLAYEAAFYDQSHFIRNFNSFTGENPASYAFDEGNMANFFLKR
jgi:AraC-like DNA-binding protein